MNLLSIFLGPLAAPECRMALARGWLILVRTLAAMAVLGASLVIVWWWWLSEMTDALHSPYAELRFGIIVVEAMLIAIALILGPAVLAGSLAGDKERGALALLLTTNVNSREIIMGRLAGKLTQVGMILLACLPALIWLTALAGLSLVLVLVAILLPVAVAIGGGGLAVVASTLSRRARDSLLTVYFLDLLFLLSPISRVLSVPQEIIDLLSSLNPFNSLDALINDEKPLHSLETISLWMLMGVIGVAIASWRLRPVALAPIDGDRVKRKGYRQLWVPPVQEDRPMIWKELFIERVGSLGHFGRWVGYLMVSGLVGGTVILAGMILWNDSKGDPNGWSISARNFFQDSIGSSGLLLSYLIQWGIGLRAGVSISSERERGTWDSLLTSPLDGGEIIVGKVWGSLYALRWLVLSALFAWIIGAVLGGITVGQSANFIAQTLIEGAFMAAIGVRTSLQSNTATRAMSVTIGLWLAAYVVIAVSATFLIIVSVLFANSLYIVAAQAGAVAPPTSLWFPVSWEIAWPITVQLLYLGITLAIVADTRLRFDRIAGRITEGGISLAVDEFLHGRHQTMEDAERELASIRGEEYPGPVIDTA